MRERVPPTPAQLGHPHKGQGQKQRESLAVPQNWACSGAFSEGGPQDKPPAPARMGAEDGQGEAAGHQQTPEPHSLECPPATSLEEKGVREEGSGDSRTGYIPP